jgi:hypothetical protein
MLARQMLYCLSFFAVVTLERASHFLPRLLPSYFTLPAMLG